MYVKKNETSASDEVSFTLKTALVLRRNFPSLSSKLFCHFVFELVAHFIFIHDERFAESVNALPLEQM